MMTTTRRTVSRAGRAARGTGRSANAAARRRGRAAEALVALYWLAGLALALPVLAAAVAGALS